MASSDKAVVTCALTGVLTDPARHPVPVTPEQMAVAAKQAFDAGASVMHVHYRQQEQGLGHLPSWDPQVAAEITDAIRAACPGVIINMSTGVIGEQVDDVLACLHRVKPEIAACNAGSLNYLKVRKDGSWAWPPLLFDNPVSKVSAMLNEMQDVHCKPELECFDVGIVRSVELYVRNGMLSDPQYNFVMGIDSGMPADPELLPLLMNYRLDSSPWQVTAIGRSEVWPLHRRAAELGGHLRTGLEDCFYLPNGEKARNNGEMVEALVSCARDAGRDIASPEESRGLL